MDYYSKYLKYKAKYLNLKNNLLGSGKLWCGKGDKAVEYDTNKQFCKKTVNSNHENDVKVSEKTSKKRDVLM